MSQYTLSVKGSFKDDISKGIKGAQNAISGFVRHTGEAGKGVRAFGDVLKANLASEAVINGIHQVAGAIKEVTKVAVTQGAQLEQTLGGVDTIFKGASETVQKNAEQAFKTVGLSANEYMQNVTGFSSSLIQSLSGDTHKAASVADMAMQDMADNSNKMGTAMQSITWAYQGFARQNYLMLDNLKLGYGGTKKEMERLLSDAEKLSGVKYDITNLSDVYTAIHVIQENLGITGTTAKEAEKTVSGSFHAMKAAALDLAGNVALGKDVSKDIKTLGKTTKTFLGNLVPMLKNIAKQAPSIFSTVSDAIGDMIGNIDWGSIASAVLTNIGMMANKAVVALGDVGDTISSMMYSVANTAFDVLRNINWTDVWNTLVLGLQNALNSIGKILSTLGNILLPVVNNIMSTLLNTDWEAVATNIFNSISVGISSIDWSNIGQIAMNLIKQSFIVSGNILSGVWSALSPYLTNVGELFNSVDWTSVVSTMLTGLGDALLAGLDGLGAVASTLMTMLANMFTVSDDSGESPISNFFKGLYDGAGQAIADFVSKVTTRINELFSLEKVTINMSEIISFGTNWNLSVDSIAESLSNFVSSLISTLQTLIAEADWGGIFANIGSFIAQALISSIKLVLTMKETFNSIMTELFNATVESLPDIAKGLLDSFVGFVYGFIKTFCDSIGVPFEMTGEEARTLMDWISSEIHKVVDKIVTYFQEKVNKIVGFFDSIPETINKFIEGVKTGFMNVLTPIQEVFQKVVDFIQSIEWGKLGTNIISGLINGIKEKGEQIGDVIVKFAKKAWKRVKAFFGIHSPSTLMRDSIGKYIPEGMAVGIEQKTPVVDKAMYSMGESAISQADDTLRMMNRDIVQGSTAGEYVNNSSRDTKTSRLTDYPRNNNYGGFTVNVYGAQGQSEERLAEIVEERISRKIRNDEAVFAW